MNEEARTTLAQLSDEALQHMILALGRYALSVSSRLHWRTGNARELPGGETVDSIVSLAFTKVLTGERRWDPHQAPDLQKYLMTVIDSLLNHLAEKKENTLLTTMPRVGDAHEAHMGQAVTAWHAQPPRDPETALLQQEEVQHQACMLQLLLEVSRDDPVVTAIIRAMQDGHERPGDLATTVGIPVTDVYKALKRLDRKMVRARQRLQTAPSELDHKGGHTHA